MTSRIAVQTELGRYRIFYLNFYDDLEIIDVDGVCYMRVMKWNNHRYELKYFFYHSKKISNRVYGGKKELLGAIQNLLHQDEKVRLGIKEYLQQEMSITEQNRPRS